MYDDYIGHWVSVETSNSDKPVEGLLNRYDMSSRSLHLTSNCPDCDHFVAIKEQYVVVIVRFQSKLPQNLDEKGSHYGN